MAPRGLVFALCACLLASTAWGAAPPAATAAAPGDAPKIDLSTIPKVEVEPANKAGDSGGSTAFNLSTGTGGHKTKVNSGKAVALTGFSPVWPQGQKPGPNAVLIDVVTDSPIADIKSNQVPFIQSLSEAMGVSTKQIYWYKVTSDELNTAWFIVDTDTPEAKQSVLAGLADTEKTAAFYRNAAAYTLNILNGPEVSPDELVLSEEVISKPDNWTSYDGDTGVKGGDAAPTKPPTSSASALAIGGTSLAVSLLLAMVAAAALL